MTLKKVAVFASIVATINAIVGLVNGNHASMGAWLAVAILSAQHADNHKNGQNEMGDF